MSVCVLLLERIIITVYFTPHRIFLAWINSQLCFFSQSMEGLPTGKCEIWLKRAMFSKSNYCKASHGSPQFCNLNNCILSSSLFVHLLTTTFVTVYCVYDLFFYFPPLSFAFLPFCWSLGDFRAAWGRNTVLCFGSLSLLSHFYRRRRSRESVTHRYRFHSRAGSDEMDKTAAGFQTHIFGH